MKFAVVAFLLMVSQAQALPEKFPDWLTDDKAKVWVVNQLIEMMKEREFYKVRSINVVREYSPKNKSDALRATLVFDDPKCSGRQVSIRTLARLCSDDGCGLWAALTDCMSDQPGEPTEWKFQKR